MRRLLDRLGFLSELPEKLAAMIENKLYKEAVELYNKTILVLTRHSHVLSFKNIKVGVHSEKLHRCVYHIIVDERVIGKNRVDDGGPNQQGHGLA